MKEEIRKLIISGVIILIGLVILKYIPMDIFGEGILFDASAHIVISMFILYIL